MKKIYSLIGLFLFIAHLQAKQIDLNTALSVGNNFLNEQAKALIQKKAPSLKPVYKAKADSSLSAVSQEINYYFVFNDSNSGFIIVSGDDSASPILGYSDEGSFDPNNIPQNVAKCWRVTKVRFVL